MYLLYVAHVCTYCVLHICALHSSSQNPTLTTPQPTHLNPHFNSQTTPQPTTSTTHTPQPTHHTPHLSDDAALDDIAAVLVAPDANQEDKIARWTPRFEAAWAPWRTHKPHPDGLLEDPGMDVEVQVGGCVWVRGGGSVAWFIHTYSTLYLYILHAVSIQIRHISNTICC